MNIIEKINLFISEDELNEGRKPFFKTNSPDVIVKRILEKKAGDKKAAYNYLNMLRKKAVAEDETDLAHRLSASLKLLGFESTKTNKRGEKTNSIVAAREVHKNIKKVLGYIPKKSSGDFTDAEKKRIDQYVRTRYPNVKTETLYSTLSSLK